MKSVIRSLCRTTVVVLGTGAAMLGVSTNATAEPPNCTTADVTAVVAGVSANMSAYLFTHPEVNDFFSGLERKDKATVKQQTKDYLNANPQVHAELDAIRAPGVDLRNRCNIPMMADISSVI